MIFNGITKGLIGGLRRGGWVYFWRFMAWGNQHGALKAVPVRDEAWGRGLEQDSLVLFYDGIDQHFEVVLGGVHCDPFREKLVGFLLCQMKSDLSDGIFSPFKVFDASEPHALNEGVVPPVKYYTFSHCDSPISLRN